MTIIVAKQNMRPSRGRGRGRGWSPTSGDGVGSMSLTAEFKGLETAPR